MSRTQPSVEELRERLTRHLGEWGTEVAGLLRELESHRAGSIDEEEREAAAVQQQEMFETRMAEVEAELDGARAQIEANAERCAQYESESIRLQAEVASKQDLIHMLRRESKAGVESKAQLEHAHTETITLQSALEAESRRAIEAEYSLEASRSELEVLRRKLEERESAADSQRSQFDAELTTVRSELDARRSLVASLRADTDRLREVEKELETKREAVSVLGASVDSQALRIDELQKIAGEWQNRFETLERESTEATSPGLPAFSAAEEEVLKNLESGGPASSESEEPARAQAKG